MCGLDGGPERHIGSRDAGVNVRGAAIQDALALDGVQLEYFGPLDHAASVINPVGVMASAFAADQLHARLSGGRCPVVRHAWPTAGETAEARRHSIPEHHVVGDGIQLVIEHEILHLMVDDAVSADSPTGDRRELPHALGRFNQKANHGLLTGLAAGDQITLVRVRTPGGQLDAVAQLQPERRTVKVDQGAFRFVEAARIHAGNEV
ncbi:Uncharacterised protein [Acinetobacter baumannii]|nr:Uncharacterised protein [Acinetobacter baumannii]